MKTFVCGIPHETMAKERVQISVYAIMFTYWLLPLGKEWTPLFTHNYWLDIITTGLL